MTGASNGQINNASASFTTNAANITGILPVANGGTGVSTLVANQILFGNGTSAVSQDSNLTYTAFTLTAPFINATQYTGAWTGNSIGVLYGGTGFTTYSQGQILYASSALAFGRLNKDTNATRYLSNTGTSNNPAWAQINLANGVTGTLPITNGGTGQNTPIVVAGSFSATGAATTTFTVTTGTTQANNTYKVNISPTSLVAAAVFYISNKTTTTFDVVYLTALTGAVSFDWALFS